MEGVGGHHGNLEGVGGHHGNLEGVGGRRGNAHPVQVNIVLLFVALCGLRLLQKKVCIVVLLSLILLFIY